MSWDLGEKTVKCPGCGFVAARGVVCEGAALECICIGYMTLKDLEYVSATASIDGDSCLQVDNHNITGPKVILVQLTVKKDEIDWEKLERLYVYGYWGSKTHHWPLMSEISKACEVDFKTLAQHARAHDWSGKRCDYVRQIQRTIESTSVIDKMLKDDRS